MPVLAIVGAAGYTGRLVAAAAVARGHEVVLVARDVDRVREVADGLPPDGGPGGVRGVRVADVTDPDAIRAALAGVDVVVSAVGGDAEVVHGLRRTVVETGTPTVDLSASAVGLRRAADELDASAREAGVALVAGVGWRTLPGDLLTSVAAGRVERPRAVHVAYVVPDAGGLLRASSTGARRELAGELLATGVAVVDGATADERPGEERRLAWFPRPIGPHHAAGVPGAEPIGVPRHLPGVEVVRTYLAVSSLRAELLQAAANLSRWSRLRPYVADRIARGLPGAGPSRERREATRWACVVEVEGRDGLARAWMNGRDPHGTTALMAVVVTEAVAAGRASTGVVPPALVDVPDALLDAVADAGTTRWSVSRLSPPDAAGPDGLGDDAGPDDPGPSAVPEGRSR